MEKRIKKILVAVDFSSYSDAALAYAFEISQVLNSQIVAINIINQKEIDCVETAVNACHPGSFVLAKHLSEEMGRRKLKLSALIKRCPGLEKMSVKILIGYGIPSVEILEAVDYEQADLLVFGPKGRTNLRGFLFGGVAEKLFRHCPVPVMSLRSLSE
ncbi:MAG: universal stress protein [Proteobacteria bacterium]|nr:universal stress protein [Pseudomonadota bacterium]